MDVEGKREREREVDERGKEGGRGADTVLGEGRGVGC